MEILFEPLKDNSLMTMCDGCDMVDENGGCHGTDQ